MKTVEEQQIKKRKAEFSVCAIPWFIGLSNDLMFYIAINTLFLTEVKNFTASQISFFTTGACLSYILLQRPFLKIIKKIGNTNSVRLGAIILLIGSIIITFSKSYFIMMIGQILYTISFIFKAMDSVMLKNDLVYLEKKDEYIKYTNKANIIYSIITTIIALCSGFLFNVNNYLPMYLCITVCIINVLISFRLADVKEGSNKEEVTTINNKRIKLSYVIVLIILAYGTFYSTISTGQTNVKIFIQYQLNNHFGIELTATYFSYILVMSRISRVLSNIGFYKIYNKVKNKIGYYLPIICGIAFITVIVGSFIPQLLIKFVLMSIGFCMILGTRDVFDTYMKDLLLKNTRVKEQQTGISYLGLSRRIGETSISFIFSLVLLKVDLFYVIVLLILLSFISFIINFKLYKMVKNNT